MSRTKKGLEQKPPKIAEWLLHHTLDEIDRDFVLGDFEEFYTEIRNESGAINASVRYWWQILKSLPHFISNFIYWRIDMLRNYLKIALRNILKHKVFSSINIVGLAISLSLCLLVIKLIFSIYSSDRFHANKDRIYRVTTLRMQDAYQVEEYASAPLPLANELNGIPEIEIVLRIKSGFGGEAVSEDKTLQVHGLFTDKEFFDVFSFELEIGDAATALAEPNSIVLTKELALKFFGNRNPVGKVVSVKNFGEFTITGVVKKAYGVKSHLRFDLLASASTLISLENQNKLYPSLENWQTFYNNYVYLLLQKDASPNKIAALFAEIVKKNYPDKETSYAFQLQALTDISPGKTLENQLSHPIPPFMAYIFSFIALIITLIACFNYTNLSIAKALSRAKEVGIRKVIGANRSHLFTQFIGEAIIISLIALIFAYAILQFLVPAFYNLNSEVKLFFDLENQNSLGLYFAFILFTVLTGVLAGIFPALYLSKFNTASILKDVSKLKLFPRLTLRKALIVFQFSISLIFIITTTVVFKQVGYVKRLNYGFNAENILNVELQGNSFEVFKQEISSYSNIKTVSAAAILPNTAARTDDYARCENSSDSIEVDYLSVDENFLENIELELVAGRNFPKNLSSENEKFVILNETAVQRFGFGSPAQALGKSITFEAGTDLQIIGVLKDFIHQSFHIPIRPLALRYLPQFFRYANLKINANDIEGTIHFLEEKWKKLDPVHSFKYAFYKDQIQESFMGPDIMQKILSFIAFLVIFITFFGLLGMVIFDTEAKVKEIGIRKVLGAKVYDIIWVISRGFINLLLLAAILATPVAWFINDLFLQNVYPRIELGFGFFAFGILSMFAISFIIIFSQTIKAARANPVDVLKYE